MIVIAKAVVLAIGLNGKENELKELPIQLISMDRGFEAIKCFKKERISSAISFWDLPDMPDGRFLKTLKAAKPKIPTIAFIEPGNSQQEIAARGMGVSAVLSEDVDEEHFRETVCQILHLDNVSCIKNIHSRRTNRRIEVLRNSRSKKLTNSLSSSSKNAGFEDRPVRRD
ncbi:MAG: hypothetical protein ABIG61_06375 [Planctomycetota bacterium]